MFGVEDFFFEDLNRNILGDIGTHGHAWVENTNFVPPNLVCEHVNRVMKTNKKGFSIWLGDSGFDLNSVIRRLGVENIAKVRVYTRFGDSIAKRAFGVEFILKNGALDVRGHWNIIDESNYLSLVRNMLVPIIEHGLSLRTFVNASQIEKRTLAGEHDAVYRAFTGKYESCYLKRVSGIVCGNLSEPIKRYNYKFLGNSNF